MYEQKNPPSDQSAAQQQDAIDINDFVFAATGARIRRLTLPDGTHWFPAMDVAGNLGYANTRDAVHNMVPQQHVTTLGDIARSVGQSDAARNITGHGLRKTMKMVNLQGLIQLVNGCTKPESQPFKDWVSEVIKTIQVDGSYSLEPAPVQPSPTDTTAYVMPQQVADAIVRLEERNIRADEMLTAFQQERNDLLKQLSRSQDVMAQALRDIAENLRRPADRPRSSPAPELTPQQLLANWKARNLVSPRTSTPWRPTWPRRCYTAAPTTTWRRSRRTRVCPWTASATAWRCCANRSVCARPAARRTGHRSTCCRSAVTPV
ncbi:BRO-N domain-containing protein [Streptomyces tailanensis]|uniref:BRO-N domain-containing protein n=1 Tax=Streptomyces tailanensis TaxID=2569858 RepID=UPI001FE497BA|nr:Bro-N domain-containing protein [Streptomyces tailanensis]